METELFGEISELNMIGDDVCKCINNINIHLGSLECGLESCMKQNMVGVINKNPQTFLKLT